MVAKNSPEVVSFFKFSFAFHYFYVQCFLDKV